ncbi:hypothetical protein [Microbaculum marinum]|uniref:Uncharacterized protein n=1 Tax=Microbaculum marinum TaxID=1764581 RepID=A0AAW9RUT0_9HYPH
MVIFDTFLLGVDVDFRTPPLQATDYVRGRRSVAWVLPRSQHGGCAGPDPPPKRAGASWFETTACAIGSP